MTTLFHTYMLHSVCLEINNVCNICFPTSWNSDNDWMRDPIGIESWSSWFTQRLSNQQSYLQISLVKSIYLRLHLFFVINPSVSLPCTASFVTGAGGRSHQPPARNGHADLRWGTDNWAAVITWWIPSWREVRHPGTALESCQPWSPGKTQQVSYSWKHIGFCISYGMKIFKGQMWMLTHTHVDIIFCGAVKFGMWYNTPLPSLIICLSVCGSWHYQCGQSVCNSNLNANSRLSL